MKDIRRMTMTTSKVLRRRNEELTNQEEEAEVASVAVETVTKIERAVINKMKMASR